MTRDKGAPRLPKQSPQQIARNADAEKARKKASKEALAATKKAGSKTKPAPTIAVSPAILDAKRATERANALAAMRVDYEALGGSDSPAAWELFLADAGYAPDGSVLNDPDAKPAKDRKVTEDHPMFPLVVARKHYVKGANGNPHNNDPLAVALSGMEAKQVIHVLIAAMKLESNPYSHLNPGQQSMNLRNKARGQMRGGFLQQADVVAAIKQVAA